MADELKILPQIRVAMQLCRIKPGIIVELRATRAPSALNTIGGGISRGTQELRERGSNLLNFNRHQAG
jgi:hypothetical protein